MSGDLISSTGATMNHQHVLLVSHHHHGHLNPCIQLALNLIRFGARVTLATTVNGFHKLKSLPSHHGLSFASFSDGHDDDINAQRSPDYFHDIKRMGSESLVNLIQTLSESGNKVTLVILTIFLPWVALVARELNLPSAVLLVQSATSFWMFERFFNIRDGIFNVSKDIDTSMISLKLPGLPVFKSGDFPTYVLPTNPYFPATRSLIQEHLQFLEENPNSHVLVNTLDGLEPDSIASIKNAVVIGPLVSISNSSSVSGSYFEWLDSKPDESVVFVSFGSMAMLTKTQKKELLHGLIESERPFLLVLRDVGEEEDVEIKELKERVGDQGLIMEWCSQVEVLRHRAIGCFVTHCGWNSTLESLVAGVAIVGYPQFADQTMNAKMVAEVWGNGVRMVADEAMVVAREEIKRCLKVVMDGGDMAEEIKMKVEKWKKVVEESVKDGGSSILNLKLFLREKDQNGH